MATQISGPRGGIVDTELVASQYALIVKDVGGGGGGGAVTPNANFDSKQVTVAVAGTAVALALGATNRVTVRASDANAGNVAVGDATVTMGTGYVLTPGESTNVLLVNDTTALMFVNAATNGDLVTVSYES